jgi:hypothetical protein
MRRRAIIPFLCAAALTLASVPGLARVGVVVGIAPPAPVVEAVPAPPAPGTSGSRVTGAGTAYSMSGCPVHTWWRPTFTRYGFPKPGSGMAPAGCGSVATGGTAGDEVGRATPRPRLCCERRRLFGPAGSSGLFPNLRETEKAAEHWIAKKPPEPYRDMIRV